MYQKLPSLTGRQLIRLLEKDGFYKVRQTKHGQGLAKDLPDGRKVVTVIPIKRGELTIGTLKAILKQSQINVEKLNKLIEEHGK